MAETKASELAAVRKEISEVVGSEAVRMVRRIIAEIDIRHCTAMKYLFELAGLYPATTREETRSDDSLAKTLLRRLGLEDGPVPEQRLPKIRGRKPRPVRRMP
jgi:hypothetical protein